MVFEAYCSKGINKVLIYKEVMLTHLPLVPHICVSESGGGEVGGGGGGWVNATTDDA